MTDLEIEFNAAVEAAIAEAKRRGLSSPPMNRLVKKLGPKGTAEHLLGAQKDQGQEGLKKLVTNHAWELSMEYLVIKFAPLFREEIVAEACRRLTKLGCQVDECQDRNPADQ